MNLYQLTLDSTDIQAIGDALDKEPAGKVFALITKIQTQITAQIQASKEAASAKAAEREEAIKTDAIEKFKATLPKPRTKKPTEPAVEGNRGDQPPTNGQRSSRPRRGLKHAVQT